MPMPVFRRATNLGSKGPVSKLKPIRKEIKNVVIFGETGVGKSSLINLIAGSSLSETSSSAAGCTLEYKRHLLKIGDQHFAVWDTAGLDEGSQGSVPAEKAEAYLRQLLYDLARAGGVDLLVYCVRGTRVRSALLANYHLFYSVICRRKVPIVIAITGLENEEGNMDTWWLKNENQFTALQMHFDDYACVTTLESPMENATLKERRAISKAGLIKMITSTCRTEQWMPAERSWLETAFFDIRSMLSPRGAGQGAQTQTHVANVILCDTSRYVPVGKKNIKRSVTFHNPVNFSVAWSVNFRSPVSIMNGASQSTLPFDDAIKCTPERLFRVYQVPKRQISLIHKLAEMKMDMAVKRGADLLVFCVEKGSRECGDIKLQWEHFNRTYGGELSPQIVVIIGAADQQSAEGWWRDALGEAVTKHGDATITHWPTNKSNTEVNAARERLRYLVNACCIDRTKINFAGNMRIFRRKTLLPLNKLNLISLWAKSPIPGNDSENWDATSDLEDVLTKWNVWEHVQGGR